LDRLSLVAALSFVVVTLAVSFVFESTMNAPPWPVLERLSPGSRLHPRACEVARGMADLRALEKAFGDHGPPLASGSMVDVFLGETIQFDSTGAYVLVLDALRSRRCAPLRVRSHLRCERRLGTFRRVERAPLGSGPRLLRRERVRRGAARDFRDLTIDALPPTHHRRRRCGEEKELVVIA
jgi:hypothetical protein